MVQTNESLLRRRSRLLKSRFSPHFGGPETPRLCQSCPPQSSAILECTLQRWLSQWVYDGQLVRSGNRRSTRYRLTDDLPTSEFEFVNGLNESRRSARRRLTRPYARQEHNPNHALNRCSRRRRAAVTASIAAAIKSPPDAYPGGRASTSRGRAAGHSEPAHHRISKRFLFRLRLSPLR